MRRAERRLRNPFEFGRELGPGELADRREEIGAIRRAVENRGKLFVLGPRRFGKTSVLAAAERELAGDGAVVLRYDAELYETVTALAQAVMAGAAKALTPSLEKAGEAVRQALRGMRPEVAYDPVSQRLTVGLAAVPAKDEVPALARVFDGVERLAAARRHPTAIFLDEFQQVMRDGGEAAERQIRAAIQRHAHVAYVFAGSRTRLLEAMTGRAGRPFWRLGARLVIGPVPREEFARFLEERFRSLGGAVEAAALERIMAVAEDVPYNVQRLAHECWERLRVEPGARLTEAGVDEALDAIVRSEHAAYARLWVGLTRAQRIALKAVLEERGRELTSSGVLRRHGLGSSTMQKALRALEAEEMIRLEEAPEGRTWRLEDPFFAEWLRAAQAR